MFGGSALLLWKTNNGLEFEGALSPARLLELDREGKAAPWP